jgi:hypothetical protein
MPTVATPTDFRRALPTFKQAAALIEIDATGIGRAVNRLGLTPVQWGAREKRLQVVDLLRIAAHARRATVNEVAAGLLNLVSGSHPEMVDHVRREVDRYFAKIHGKPNAQPADEFLAEVTSVLPAEHAETVAKIYRRYIAKE